MIQISNLSDVKKQILEHITKKEFPTIVDKTIANSKRRLAFALVRAFKRTIVSKGLLGKYAFNLDKDIPAHMGLVEAYSIQSEKDISDALFNAIKFGPLVRKGNSISFTVTTDDLGQYVLSEVQGIYTSENSKGESTQIPWLDWLINGGRVSATVSISGDFADKVFSRSQRAIMTNPNGGDWDTEDYNRFSESGDGFVVDIVEDEKFYLDSEYIIRSELNKIIGD